jgi:hypothetical protein
MADPTAALETAIQTALSGDATLAALLPGTEHLVTVTDATGGTFTLTYGGATTAAIAYNATAATVKTRLEALASVGAGNVVVTGNAGGPWTVTFGGTLAGSQAAITGSGALLEGAGATLTIAQRAAIYNTMARDGAAFPMALFQKVAATPRNSLGARSYWEYLYQVRVIGESRTYGVVLAALARIDALLERQVLTVTGATVMAILRDSDLPAMTVVEAGTTFRQVGSSWRFWVQET